MKPFIKGLALAFVVLLTCFLIQCTKDSPSGPDNTQKITLTGKVVDKAGTGLSGVSVTSDPAGHTTTSASNGSFSLPDIEAGNYLFKFHLADYLDTTVGPIELGPEEVVPLSGNVVMRYRFATIKGTVQDQTGALLAGAGVTVEDQGVYTMSVTGGQYTLNRVEPGNLTLFSAKDGYGFGTTDLAAVADSTYENVPIQYTLNGGTITGKIIEQGVAVANAEVSAVGGALTVTTDSSGHFSISGVPSDLALMLTVVKPTGDTMYMSGVEVDEGQAVDLDTIPFQSPVSQNSITLYPTVATIDAGTLPMFLMVQITTSGGVTVDAVEWDLDNDGTYDSTTAGKRLTLNSLPWSSTGVKQVKVRARDTKGNYSAVVTVRVTVTGQAMKYPAPGTYETDFVMVDTGWAGTYHDKLIINPDSTAKEYMTTLSGGCSAMRYQGSMTPVSDSLFTFSGYMQDGDTCTGSWQAWEPADSSTGAIVKIGLDSFVFHFPNMQNLAGGPDVVYRKTSSATDTSDWTAGAYSNASFAGPWIMLINEIPLENNWPAYIVFDGTGGIIEMGVFGISAGDYSVMPDGSCSGLVYPDSTFFFGRFLNDTLVQLQLVFTDSSGPDTSVQIHMVKVADPAYCQGSWSGTFTPGPTVPVASRAPKNITLAIDANGSVQSATGLASPVTGKLFYQTYNQIEYLVGHLFTGETAVGWNEIGLDSVVVNGNTASGSYAMECNCDGGLFTLTRGSQSTVNMGDYNPMGLGWRWTYHTAPGDTQPRTFRKIADGVDTISGQPYFQLRQIIDNEFGANNSSGWCTWMREDTSGILLGAIGDSTGNIAAANVFAAPYLWWPTGAISQGFTWDVDSPEMGGHFWYTVTSLSATAQVPAGTFTNCIIVHLVITDSLGDTTQYNDYTQARDVGEVINDGWSWYSGDMRLELQSYVKP